MSESPASEAPELANKIARLVEERGWNQEDFARIANLNRQTVRQILLHILPGDPGYGSAIFGYHYYTWAFILFVAALVLLALMLLLEGQFDAQEAPPRPFLAGRIAVLLVIGLTAANILSTLAICGFSTCPDNPVRYELFQRR